MIVYHGTISSCAENIIKNGILLEKGKPKVDFGQGFYTTNSYGFAKSTAKNKAEKTNMHCGKNYVRPIVLKFDICDGLMREFNVLKFSDANLKWAQFIINNRNGYEYIKKINSHFHNLDHKFDIVIGSIADNKISLLAKELKELKEKVTDTDICNMVYPYYTNQISFHTSKSLSCIKLLDCDIIINNQKKGDVVNE